MVLPLSVKIFAMAVPQLPLRKIPKFIICCLKGFKSLRSLRAGLKLFESF
jgi:hypothetical protein